jgi:hypothetical protein
MTSRASIVPAALAVAVLAQAASGWGRERADAPAASRPASAASAAPAAVAKRAVLVVLGGGKRVQQASVQLKLPSDMTLSVTSNDDGEVSLALSAVSKVNVRVIAQGWATYNNDLQLTPGKRTEITLEALR